MNLLRILNDDRLDRKLTKEWLSASPQGVYECYVKTLDPNIIDVAVENAYDAIVITFEKEEDLTFFILRWS